MIFKMKRIDTSKLTYNEKVILQQLMAVDNGKTLIHDIVQLLVYERDTIGFKQGLLELGEMVLGGKESMTKILGENAVDAVATHYEYFLKEYEVVKSCITKALTQEHLDLGAKWIKEKMAEKWCAYRQADELQKLIQLRQVELQCFT